MQERGLSGEKKPAPVALTWKKEMLAKLSQLQDTEDITIKYLLLGGVPIVAFPFEGFTMIGQSRNITGRQDSLMLGCGEEAIGLSTHRDDIAVGHTHSAGIHLPIQRLPVMPGESEAFW